MEDEYHIRLDFNRSPADHVDQAAKWMFTGALLGFGAYLLHLRTLRGVAATLNNKLEDFVFPVPPME